MKYLISVCVALLISGCFKSTKRSVPVEIDTKVVSHRVLFDLQDVNGKYIYFEFDSYKVLETEYPQIRHNAKKAKKSNLPFVVISGHCDDRGSKEYNDELGMYRAYEVGMHYVKLGVPSEQIQLISYGEERPVCFEKTEECYQKNRRVETKIIGEINTP